MKRSWEQMEHWRKMKHGYFKKLRIYQGYGKENRMAERLAEIKSSIKVISRFMYNGYKANKL